jgi:hypothetical protein
VCGVSPLLRPTGPDGAVSVAALLRREGLRREGRGPHAADRPLVPRGHARAAQPPPGPASGSQYLAVAGDVPARTRSDGAAGDKGSSAKGSGRSNNGDGAG